MSAFDDLPPRVREWLRAHRPGVRIDVPKELTARERADRAEKIRRAYRDGIEAGADPKRLVSGIASEFGMDLSNVYKLLIGETGKDSNGHEG